ncbi:MAG: IclR family transcriptional regulator C-terminal domain-containing protein [Pseudomonadota bacterium]
MLDTPTEPSKSSIQVISRAVEILRAVSALHPPPSLGKIASKVDLPRSTVQRIVGALAEEGLVIHEQGRGGVRLGPQMASLAAAAHAVMAEDLHEILLAISAETGETTDLAVLRGDHMVFVDQVAGTQRLRTVSSVGEQFPLTTTANGRSCLSILPEALASKLIATEIERLNMDCAFDDVRQIIDSVRATGFASDLSEHTDGISALGFAFQMLSGDYYAISVPVPSTRFDQKRPLIEAALNGARTRLAQIVPGIILS